MTVDAVKTTLVDPFPDSATRDPLYARWLQHRSAVAAIIPILRQWVDGSYVTTKLDPGDIDVVTFVDGPTVDALDDGRGAILGTLVDGHDTRDVWGVDSFLVAVYPEGHPLRAASRKVEGSWVHQWSRVRGGSPTASKGFVEVL